MIRPTMLAVTTLLAAISASASDHDKLIREATAALDNDFEAVWAFTETTVDSDGTTVARFNPSLADGEKWRLLVVDGRPANEDEQADFRAENKDDSPSGDNDDSADKDTAAMFAPDSMLLIEETDEHWLFSFVPNEDEFEKGFAEHIEGTFRIRKHGQFVDIINLQSRKPFRPRFGVKISQFGTRMTFARAGENGPLVPMSIDIKIKARAFLAIGIDEVVSISYSDYEYVGG